MRKYKIVHEEVLEKLSDIFREFGYDGASLTQLAASSGLKKASLYHRFPKGKEEMGEAVLSHVEEWTEKHVFHFLFKNGTPEERRDEALGSVLILYNHGFKSCLMNTMNIGNGFILFGEKIAFLFKRWVDGFTKLGIDFGMSAWKAQQLAEEVMVRIQGALVITRTSKNKTFFVNTLTSIKACYASKITERSVEFANLPI